MIENQSKSLKINENLSKSLKINQNLYFLYGVW
jgi:hypothetical protein